MKKYISLFLLLIAYFTSLQAQTGGDHVYSFMNLVTSARVSAQGENAIANPEADLNFALYNPALLSDTMHNLASISIVDYVSDISYYDAAYARRFKKIPGMFYGQIRYFDYGEFQRADIIGIRQGTFMVNDFSINLGYSYQIDSVWTVGAKLKSLFSNYDIYSSSGMAMDVGITYHIPQHQILIALLLKNMGGQFEPYAEEKESLPFEIQAGISYKLAHAPFRFQLTLDQLQQPDLTYDDPNNTQTDQLTGEVITTEETAFNQVARHMIFAAEFSPTPNFNLQFGYNVRRREELNLETRRTAAGFSFGGGIKISKFRINYARNTYHVSGASNHISLTTDLKQF